MNRHQRLTVRADLATPENSRVVTVKCSTESLGRDNIVMMSSGIDLTFYRDNPVWLWQHDPDCPIARAETIGVIGSNLIAKVRFPDAGESAKSDEVYALIKAGVINAASSGVDILESEPLDPSRRDGGIRIVRCELQEMSFVSIPAVPDALIIERAHRRDAYTPRASRSMQFHRRMARLYAAELVHGAGRSLR